MLEVYVSTPLAVCESRDPKGLYKSARLGEIADFTGVSASYETPLDPELSLDTSALSPVACVGRIMPLLFP
jgi:adenylylsulfate kinase